MKHPVTVFAALLATLQMNDVRAAEPVNFGRDVLPILQRACFECHGAKKREAGLRLDQRNEALRDQAIIKPGNAGKSELVRRISLPAGDDEIMPSRGKPLSKDEIRLIRNWIDGGAHWPEELASVRHWAYQPPVRHTPPQVDFAGQAVRNPIDAWILARLRNEGLSFSEPADKPTLIRRVSLDLIGLPPSPAEVEAFVNDESPEAYEKLVDRLLASRQYGVRWARPWLDYARYADSHGFQRDDFRDLWPYRDWVVDALNQDMPFTQFTLEQLAGDLLPNATESQRVATGFNRSAPTNVEAGSDPEETRVNQIHNRVNTLGMVWLGTTLECAQCHDHKYDPFTMRDYYGLFAFFNNTSLEADRTNPKVPGSIQFKGPSMELSDTAVGTERARISTQLAEVTRSLATLTKSAEANLVEWETALRTKVAQGAQEHVLSIADFDSLAGATHEILSDQSVLISGEPAPDKDTYVVTARTQKTGIRGIKLEALTDPSLPGKGPGRGDEQRPNFVLNNLIVAVSPTSEPKQAKGVKFTSARASFSQANFPVTNLLKTGNDARGGWAINPKFHELHWAILETAEPLGFDGGTELTLRLEQNYGGGRTIGRLRVSIITGEIGGKASPADVTDVLAISPEKRSDKQRQVLVAFRLRESPEYTRLEEQRTQLEAQLRGLKLPSTLVMREDTPRSSTLFVRGDFRTPGERVEPAIPRALRPNLAERPAAGASSLGHNPHVVEKASTEKSAVENRTDDRKSTGGPAERHQRIAGDSSAGNSADAAATKRSLTRLDLAQWLVSRENPLVARVVVNRWWGELFGHGLVGTAEDFGMKGDRPTHPELLDWLACEFMDQGWSQKKLLRTIVMSRTYRQSSRISTESLAKDDRGRLYSRGPRHRLEAELIRDNALAIAGLLNLRLGGPPIRPYQPEGLWVKVGGQRYDYVVSPGEEKYRRGLYVVWKRGAPYPSFVNFDADNRMVCRVQRPRSNTPLQALALMNDPVYVEAALAFARRVMTEQPGADDATRIGHAFRLAVSRSPRPEEVRILQDLLRTERAARQQNAKAAREFLGTFELPEGISAVEFTAWYAVAAAILNLDETISKG